MKLASFHLPAPSISFRYLGTVCIAYTILPICLPAILWICRLEVQLEWFIMFRILRHQVKIIQRVPDVSNPINLIDACIFQEESYSVHSNFNGKLPEILLFPDHQWDPVFLIQIFQFQDVHPLTTLSYLGLHPTSFHLGKSSKILELITA